MKNINKLTILIIIKCIAASFVVVLLFMNALLIEDMYPNLYILNWMAIPVTLFAAFYNPKFIKKILKDNYKD